MNRTDEGSRAASDDAEAKPATELRDGMIFGQDNLAQFFMDSIENRVLPDRACRIAPAVITGQRERPQCGTGSNWAEDFCPRL